TVSMECGLTPETAFETFIEELTSALKDLDLRFEPGIEGRITQGAFEVGRVVEWTPGQHVRLRWSQADWQPEAVTEVELWTEPSGDGARVTFAHHGWGALIGDAVELVGWFASAVAAPLMRATAPTAFGDWLIDRGARRPTGAQARGFYRDPLYHWPNFRVILAELDLTAADYLVEIGCGGGALLKEALESGCRAAAIDHSIDMVRLASDENRDAIAESRLTIQQASADNLPFSDGAFTCAVMTGVLGLLPDPIAALRELHRVLADGGRIIIMGSDPLWRDTPAVGEPAASRLRFYDDSEFRELAVAAGFSNAHVERRVLEQYAREAGVPEEHLPIFGGIGTPFLFARKA
ncbi:MAG TPA: methyltransferase domain-containing protein, partial [Ktedonobacterales bacterium]|nr:methyltransferase domain-containing protein [Ktedonobacterales bacterium]